MADVSLKLLGPYCGQSLPVTETWPVTEIISDTECEAPGPLSSVVSEASHAHELDSHSKNH